MIAPLENHDCSFDVFSDNRTIPLCSPSPFDKEEIRGKNQQLRQTRTTPTDCDDEGMALAHAAPPINNNLGMILCELRMIFVHNEEMLRNLVQSKPNSFGYTNNQSKKKNS